MTTKRELEDALGAHALWKMRLRAAISQGKLDVPVPDLRRDDGCDFGRWLRGPSLPPVEKASPRYLGVLRLHAEFHQAAANVAELALGGKKDDATRMLNSGRYAEVSFALVRAVEAWRDAES